MQLSAYQITLETIYTSLGAVSLGASIIEKHFTDNKKK